MSAPGQDRVLGGRYALGDPLGYGGMSEVFRGTDARLGRTVAVKVLRPDLARDPSFLVRFRREAQSAAALSHPNVVGVYDTGVDGSGPETVPFIVMEFVEGRTLRDVLQDEGRLLPRRALEMVAEVCEALEYSHRAGIVHRDIKPANVMLTPAGEIKVMDFGIARALTAASSTMTATAAVIGTAQYLSPEQARGEHVDARSDVYSTGCLLYELLTGQPPFTGDSPVAVAYQHVREDPVTPSAINSDIPDSVDAIVLKAMAKNPANRYQSAAEMRADLDRAATGRPVLATPVLPGPAVSDSVAATTYARSSSPAGYLGADAGATTLLRTPSERRRNRGFAYAALGLAVIAVFVVAALLASRLIGVGGTTTVSTPDLSGQTRAQAAATLQGLGLGIGDTSEAFSPQTVGTIIDQDPVSGISLRPGGPVNLVISKGIENVAVPQLVDLTIDQARQQLAASKLRVGTIAEENADRPAGTILRSDPVDGTLLAAGSTVNLVLASGKFAVPDVRGQDISAARTTLEAAGFVPRVTNAPNGTVAPNTVLQQSPVGGTAARGSDVNLVVASAPTPSPTPSPSTSTSASASPSPTASASPSASPSPSAVVSPPVSPPPSRAAPA